MAKKNKMTQIMAFLALFGIIIGIIGTGVLVFFSGSNTSTNQELTPDQYLELQELIKSQSGITIETNSGSIKTLTGETK